MFKDFQQLFQYLWNYYSFSNTFHSLSCLITLRKTANKNSDATRLTGTQWNNQGSCKPNTETNNNCFVNYFSTESSSWNSSLSIKTIYAIASTDGLVNQLSWCRLSRTVGRCRSIRLLTKPCSSPICIGTAGNMNYHGHR